MARAQRVAVTDPLVTGTGFGYADAFEIELGSADGRSAEEWARTALEDVPRPVRSPILLERAARSPTAQVTGSGR